MRSKMWVPGDIDDIANAVATCPADAVTLDLEDTVVPSRKVIARRNIADFILKSATIRRSSMVMVRVNGLDKPEFQGDLEVVVAPEVEIINVPKIESADEARVACEAIRKIAERRSILKRPRVLLTVESPKGLRNCPEIATAHPDIIGLQAGFADLLEPYGIDRGNASILSYVRSRIKFATAEAGILALDGVLANVSEPDVFRADSLEAFRMGFDGKSCFNAEQAVIANEVFMPTAEALAKAQKIVAAADIAIAEGKGLFELDGRMVDEPFINGARRLIRLATSYERQ